MNDNRTRVGALDTEAVQHARGCSTCDLRVVTLVHRPAEPQPWWVEPPAYCPRCGRKVTA